MFQIDGKFLPIDTPFEHNDIQYPANWLRLSSQEDRATLGIVEIAEPVRADDRFYWNGDITMPKDLDQLKAQMVSQIKQAAASMLSSTDWKIVRAAEGIKSVDEATLFKRQAIRKASDENEQAIQNCDTVEKLALLNFSWPVDEVA